MKKITLSLAVISLLTASSCKKENCDTPMAPPPSEAELSRTILYTGTGETKAAAYSTSSIQAIVNDVTAGYELSLRFAVPFPKGNDVVLFTIHHSKLKAGYVGNYSIVRGNDGSSGDVKAQYNYLLSASSGNMHLPGMAEGQLNITHYDEKYKTLSGSYNLEIISNQDPSAPPLNNWKDNKITITGSFKNIPIKKA